MIFGLFKKNKDKIATEIYNTIGPHIELAKKFGKIKNGSSFGHEFINDKYLVSFFNTYIAQAAKYSYEIKNTTDSGYIIIYAAELIDKKYFTNQIPGFMSPIEYYSSTVKSLYFEGGDEYRKAAADCTLFYAVLTNWSDLLDKFKSNTVYKKAIKYIDSGKHKKLLDDAERLMNSPMLASKNAPRNIKIAYHILELTFIKRLNKVFKV